jgi:hypothetical protein
MEILLDLILLWFFLGAIVLPLVATLLVVSKRK